ncbi:hypothetical protein [Nostoc sp.]|uniref:hypothetical protein n=1 Tax=Nostoc sp. TaxID=1180 RepID=UPI002FFCDE75
MTNFLQSDDLVAVKVRKLLKEKSLKEIAIELEISLSLSEQEDRIYALKNVLVGSVAVGESNSEISNEIDEIELLILAEELLDKLTEIFG